MKFFKYLFLHNKIFKKVWKVVESAASLRSLNGYYNRKSPTIQTNAGDIPQSSMKENCSFLEATTVGVTAKVFTGSTAKHYKTFRLISRSNQKLEKVTRVSCIKTLFLSTVGVSAKRYLFQLYPP